MVAVVAIISIFVMLQNYALFSVAGIFKFQSFNKFDGYDTILLGLFSVLCIRSLGSVYYVLQACTLKHHVFSLQPHPLVATIFFLRFAAILLQVYI